MIGIGVDRRLQFLSGWSPLELESNLKLWLRPESLTNPNLLRYTEDAAQAVWSYPGTTQVHNLTDPNGGSAAWSVTTSGSAQVSPQQNALTWQAGETFTAQAYIRVSAGAGGYWLQIDDGVGSTSAGLYTNTDWQLRTVTRTLDASATQCRWQCTIQTNTTIEIAFPQLEVGSTATTYKMNGATAGGIVDQWDDVSGNGNHASQATQANMPLVVANSLDNKSGALFDGVDDFLSLTSTLSVTGGMGFYAVFTAGADSMILTNDTSTDYVFRALDTSQILSRPAGAASAVLSTGEIVSGNSHLVEVARDGSNNYTLYLDGTDITDATPSGAGTHNASIIGRRSTTYGDFTLIELVVVGAALSADNRAGANSYFRSRFPTLGVS